MLADFPGDFTYVLGLQEAVVVGMADGYAQATGRPALVNLHTAPGVGNAMGAIFNAQANKSPLVITAGQQVRGLMTLQANLTNRDATRMPHPLVKWAYEPPRAEDVPHALARATHLAALPPQGPVFLSIPMDDWGAEVDDDATAHAHAPHGRRPRAADPAVVAGLAARLAAARSPLLVAGPDLDAGGGLGRGGRARRSCRRCRSGRARRRAADASGFPRATPGSRGSSPRRSVRSARRSRATTSSWSPARRSSATTRTSPGRSCRPGPSSWRSPAIRTRRPARRWGTRSSPTSG